MKLEPRTRAKAALFELESDSNYLLLFKNASNAHLYKKAKQAKKAVIPKTKKDTPPVQRPAPTQRKQITINRTASHPFPIQATGGAILWQLNTAQQPTQMGWAKAPSPPAQATWQWKCAENASEWNDYAPFVSSSIERDYQKWIADGKPTKPDGSVSNFEKMRNGGAFIQRVGPPAPALPPSAERTPLPSATDNTNAQALSRGTSLTHRWDILNDNGVWINFAPGTSANIETAYLSWKQRAVCEPKVFIGRDFANFVSMEINLQGGAKKTSKIRRVLNF